MTNMYIMTESHIFFCLGLNLTQSMHINLMAMPLSCLHLTELLVWLFISQKFIFYAFMHMPKYTGRSRVGGVDGDQGFWL